jgi:opacity protein-like surface antigen
MKLAGPASLLAAAAAASLLATPATAAAGGYLSVGLGGSPSFNDELEGRFSGEGHSSARVMVGQRFGRLALEAGLGGYGLHGIAGDTADVVDGRAVTASVSAKLHIPLGERLTGYVRGGLGRTWVSSDSAMELEGDGYHGGVGIEYSLDLALTQASVWVEARRDLHQLDRMGAQYDGSADTLSVGLSFGL